MDDLIFWELNNLAMMLRPKGRGGKKLCVD
jgi:hypothetical protein